jgi:hypothetical protein
MLPRRSVVVKGGCLEFLVSFDKINTSELKKRYLAYHRAWLSHYQQSPTGCEHFSTLQKLLLTFKTYPFGFNEVVNGRSSKSSPVGYIRRCQQNVFERHSIQYFGGLSVATWLALLFQMLFVCLRRLSM